MLKQSQQCKEMPKASRQKIREETNHTNLENQKQTKKLVSKKLEK